MARASQRIEVAESDRDALDRQVKELVEELAKQEAADQTQKLTAELDAVKHRLNESHVAVEDKEQRITKLRAEISTLKSESLEAIVDEMRKTLADKGTF
ncbi:hypothetical protein BC828DRAFT_280344 [Blastocladiella britannica]|nr:hypothetical protein BC828DRAFT_280344 [Blastocladiella britannica]